MLIKHCTGNMIPSLTGAHGRNEARWFTQQSFEDIHEDLVRESLLVMIWWFALLILYGESIFMMHAARQILDRKKATKKF